MADTIIIETPVATVLEVSGKQGPQGVPGATGATGATGPQGPAGTGIETLTTKGDLLSRNDNAAIRVGIGSTGQVLKVSAQGLPSWANESGAVTSVNGATGAVTVAAEQHAAEHEAGEADEIQATAALVDTDYLPLNGVYFHDGTFTNGRPNFFKTGTRKNTKLEYNTQWKLIRNNVVEAVGVDGPNTVPWGQTWEEFVTPTSVSVTQLPLETMVQKLAETGGAATATTSEDGLMSSADKTKLNGISSGAEVNVQANWTEADSGSDAFILNKPSTFTPTAHAASHASSGSDPLAPSDIGAQSLFTTSSITGATTLSAARAVQYDVANFGSAYDITILTTGSQQGDIVVFRSVNLINANVRIKFFIGPSEVILGTLTAVGQQLRFIYRASAQEWTLVPVDSHPADRITSGTLAHERGGLEADVSAYNGLVKISGGSTSAVTVTSAGEALLDDADAAAQRTTLGLGTAATAATGDFAAASHTHELTSLAATGATNGHVLTANGSNGATFAALPASGVTGAASSASDVLGVSGANITGVDANADRIVYWNNTSNKLAYGTPADAGAAAASHTHTSADINSQTASNGHVLTANGSGGASFAALPASGISNVDSTLADVMSVSGSNLVADDGGLVDSSNPVLTWDDAAGKAVWANPLRRTAAGAFYVGVAPTTTALGTRALCIQADRSLAADRVPTGVDSVAIGNSSQAQNAGSTAVGFRARANNTYAVSIGGESVATGNSAIAIGGVASASGAQSINISAYDAYGGNSSSATNSVGLNATADLRAMFATAAFRAVYWGGQTTNNTATILNLDAAATNRFTIAANTALAVDILLVARRSDVADKWLVARRFLGIRRDGSNNTSLIGAVQTLGTDQSAGSPTWTFALTADDTNDALQLEVTGATGETVQWRACAIYRVV